MRPKEVTRLSAMLQAPVLGYRRGRGVLDSRNPLSDHAAAGARDVARGRRGDRRSARGCCIQLTGWGVDKDLKVIRVDADPDEPERARQAAMSR